MQNTSYSHFIESRKSIYGISITFNE